MIIKSEISAGRRQPEDIELAVPRLQDPNWSRITSTSRATAAEALEFIFGTDPTRAATSRRTGPELILLDLKLPRRVERLEVLRRIKADPRTHTTPVVMLTSSREEHDIVESYALGVNSYIRQAG